MGYVDIAHVICNRLRFDLQFDSMCFADKTKAEMYLYFNWSNNCGDFIRRELVKTILTILNRNISPANYK